jgi:signal transduction histidine kinase/ActR/RegA family two-component response regulator
LRALACALLLATLGDFLVMWSDVNALADRGDDSLAWRASQARAEIEQFHIRVATYDGTQSRLDGLQDQYDVAFNRIDAIERMGHSGREEDQFMAAFRDARADLVALGPRIGALRLGDVAAARAMEPELLGLDLAATRMVGGGAPADPIRRDLLRRDGLRADAAMGLTAMLLSLGLLLNARAMARRTGEQERARQNADARGAELSRALALAQAGAGARSAFLATIGHEIRTPMNGVLGATSLLAHTRLTDTQRRWVDLARESGEALLRQLDDVLDFSALEAAALPSRREPVDMRALVEQATRAQAGPAGLNGLDLVVVVDPDVPVTVLSDPRRLTQVLRNLLSNAIRFTPSGGIQVRVSIRRRGARSWLRIAVRDTGPGIPRAARERIFEAFSQPDRSGGRGAGLGLAISRRIARMLGGDLRVAATRDGGSVFWLNVPVERATPDSTAETLAPPAGSVAVIGGAAPVRHGLELLLAAEGWRCVPAGERPDLLLCHARAPVFALDAARRITFGAGGRLESPITVATLRAALSGAGLDPAAASPVSPQDGRLRLLLADDDPINREVASSLLRHLGHDVTTVGGGPDAYAEAQMGPYDCILLDLHMPGMDGVELARALRELPLPLGAVRLVAITADADAAVHEAARSAGIDSVVIKPVTLERLVDALSRQQSPGPLTEPPAIDAAIRRGLVDRLAAGRFAGLLATFWSGLLATLAESDPWTGDDGDRRLHSLAGASASLGYRAVAVAARRARADRAAGVAGGNAALLAALAAAARADRSLLPPDLAERLEAALADTSPTAATIPATARSRS